MSGRDGPMGQLKEDYEVICKQFVDEGYKIVEQEWEENEAKKVAAKANVHDSMSGTDAMQQTRSYSDSVRQGKPNRPDIVSTQDKNSSKVGKSKVGVESPNRQNTMENGTDAKDYKSPPKKHTAKSVTGQEVLNNTSTASSENKYGLLGNLGDDEDVDDKEEDYFGNENNNSKNFSSRSCCKREDSA